MRNELQRLLIEDEVAVDEREPTRISRLAEAIDKIGSRGLRIAQSLRALLKPVARSVENPLGFLVFAFVLQLPLVLNSGYYNHDELQWISFADQPAFREIPWASWTDYRAFQYRPLTFNLWLLVSHFLGHQAIAMHFVRVLLGLAAALLLRETLIAFDVSAGGAAMAALVFLVFPFTVFTHAWVGTFADSLYLIFLLAGILAILREVADMSTSTLLRCATAAASLTALALLSKEAAVTFPALLLVAGFKRRDRVLLTAFMASSLVVGAYVALRLRTILFTPQQGSAYSWGVINIPKRLAEYTIFPFLPGCFDAIATDMFWTSVCGLSCVVIAIMALASIGWRYSFTFCVGWTIALGPILILGFSANHYAYVAGAFACAFFVWAWPRFPKPARAGVCLITVIAAFHGYREMTEMRHIGRIQHNLYRDLLEIVTRGTSPIRIRAERDREDSVLRRLLFHVPTYRHISLAGRVEIVPLAQASTDATYLMSGSGKLIPVPDEQLDSHGPSAD